MSAICWKNPNSESVLTVQKKAWPSISNVCRVRPVYECGRQPSFCPLLDAANCCLASSFASSLGDADVAFSHLHTVVDYTLELLHQIFVKTLNVKLLFHRIIEYIRPDVATSALSSQACGDLSEPLLIFILYVLRTKENVDIFHQVDGFKVNCITCSILNRPNFVFVIIGSLFGIIPDTNPAV